MMADRRVPKACGPEPIGNGRPRLHLFADDFVILRRSQQPRVSRAHGLAATRRLRRPPKPPRARDQPLSAAAQAQSGRLVALGAGGAGRGEAQRQADPALGRLRRLPLVPRHGARELRGRRHRARDERALRQHQGRPRGAARHRPDLHGGAAPSRRAGRLAADHVPHARRRADLGRHLFPEDRRATAGRLSSTCCAKSRGCSAKSRRRSSRTALR